MAEELFYQELRKLRSFIEDYDLLNKHIIVGVSGGKDSVFLIQMLHEITKNISIAHVNYQLRGAESDKDHEFVQELAKKLNLTLHDQVIPIQNELASGGNMQALAREKRYQFYNAILKDDDHSVVFVAHHQRDQVETIIRNLAHGAGVVGLSGMREKNGKVYRPLLDVPLYSIETIIHYKGWKWREDLSNEETTYDRNFIRHKVIPLFYNLNKQAEARIVHSAYLMKEAQYIIANTLEDFFNNNLHFLTENSFTFDKHNLLHSGFTQTILYNICKKYQIKERLIPEIIKLAEGHVGGKIVLPSYVIWNESRVLRFQHKADINKTIKNVQLKSVLEATDHIFTVGDYSIKSRVSKSLDNGFDNNTLYIPISEIQWPLDFRTWQEGDHMQPFGMKGNKKISRILIDNKVANADKSSQIIVSDQKGIFSVLGLQNSERTRISEEKLKILQLKFSKIT